MKHDRCKYEGCLKSACFGSNVNRIRMFCKLHKKNDMINITARKCKIVSCDKQASFGFLDGPRCIYCAVHKEDKMVHASKKREFMEI